MWLFILPVQAKVKTTYTWSIIRRMKAVNKHVRPVVTEAGPTKCTADPAVLALAAKYYPIPSPGAYAKFNQTITLDRSKPVHPDNKYEVRHAC